MKKICVKGAKIEYNNKTVRILNSYQIVDKKKIEEVLKTFKLLTGYSSRRTLKSWIKEWKAHNRLYKWGLFPTHTKDCDLEEYESIFRLIAYQILGL